MKKKTSRTINGYVINQYTHFLIFGNRLKLMTKHEYDHSLKDECAYKILPIKELPNIFQSNPKASIEAYTGTVNIRIASHDDTQEVAFSGF